MGTIYKKRVTRAMPADAELFTRQGKQFARWRDPKGKQRTAPINEAGRIVVEAGTYTAKYRDGSGVVQEVATGCRDKQAAQSVLADLERRAERVKSRIITAAEDRVIDHMALALAGHRDAYINSLRAEGRSPVHCDNVQRSLSLVADACKFSTLADLDRDALESWLSKQTQKSARTRNIYRAAWVAFANWCVATGRLVSNPFAKIAKANEAVDVRRQRRALTETELQHLLEVARQRPLIEAQTIRQGKDKGALTANVRPEVIEHLKLLGRERALIYKTLVLTGLRKNELASLTIGQVHLDGDLPYLELEAKDAKNRTAAQIPLRSDLAAELAKWIEDKRKCARGDSGERNGVLRLPMTAVPDLPSAAPLFNVPAGLIRILDRDLKAAGIPKRDDRGRTVDVHALRHSFISHLAKAGVAPRTAQAAARHSDIKLTMGTYTDPRLLDLHGALEALPTLALEDDRHDQTQRATGTDHRSAVAPNVAPATGKPRQSRASADNLAGDRPDRDDAQRFAVTSISDNKKDSLTLPVNESSKERAKRLELSTSSLGS